MPVALIPAAPTALVTVYVASTMVATAASLVSINVAAMMDYAEQALIVALRLMAKTHCV